MERPGSRLSRRQFVAGVGAVGVSAAGIGLLASCRMAAPADQRPPRVARVGYLTGGSVESEDSWLTALEQGLRELGYVEGENIVIERREAAGRFEMLPELAAELVSRPVDVILTAGTPPIRAAMQATSTIPIVMVAAADPVRTGLVTSLARPGGNVTGLSDLHSGVITKRLELLRDVLPSGARITVLLNPDNETHPLQMEDIQAAALVLGVTVSPLAVSGPDDIDGAFARIRTENLEALFLLGDRLFTIHGGRIADFAVTRRLPGSYTNRQWVQAGGLMSYGSNFLDIYRRTAYYVDRILRGAKPADLPVEQPMTFDFVVNMKTAQALGIIFPNEIMLQVTEVIQ